MSAATQPLAPSAAARGGWVWAALRSTRRAEVLWAFAIAAAISAVNALWLIEILSKPDMQFKPALVVDVLLPLACVPFVLAGWVLADRAEASRWSRTARLALASVGAAAVCGLLLPQVLDALGLLVRTLKLDEGAVELPLTLVSASLAVSVFIDVAIAFATFELLVGRAAAQRALAESLTEQAALSRKVLQSRLAAMQAQVEPRFLFDTLVGIEQSYARDAAAAAAQMDRLIAYLRVALPRLREAGSSIGAEVDLVQSYLAVVQAANGGRPALRVVLDAAVGERAFHPMLLLPLVQRALRDAAIPPATIDLVARGGAEATTLVLRVARGDLCADDDELQRVRGRLLALYGHGARLDCDAGATDATEFALRIPTRPT
ncbi:MAG: histidine kinase [Betaproteobacteria bacterium]